MEEKKGVIRGILCLLQYSKGVFYHRIGDRGETGGMSPGSVYLCVFIPMLKPRTTPILKLPLSIAS